jgi:hypothetical protein
MRELVDIDAVRLEPGYDGHQQPGACQVRTTRPRPSGPRHHPTQPDISAAEELVMAKALLEADHIRVQLQMQASRELLATGARVTRASVTQRAHQLLQQVRAVQTG